MAPNTPSRGEEAAACTHEFRVRPTYKLAISATSEKFCTSLTDQQQVWILDRQSGKRLEDLPQRHSPVSPLDNSIARTRGKSTRGGGGEQRSEVRARDGRGHATR